jgi:hypothetical protein
MERQKHVPKCWKPALAKVTHCGLRDFRIAFVPEGRMRKARHFRAGFDARITSPEGTNGTCFSKDFDRPFGT